MLIKSKISFLKQNIYCLADHDSYELISTSQKTLGYTRNIDEFSSIILVYPSISHTVPDLFKIQIHNTIEKPSVKEEKNLDKQYRVANEMTFANLQKV